MKEKPTIHIGTSGWHYKSWKGDFYPRDLDERQFLDYYSKRFDTTEINNSFYKVPSEYTLKDWKDRVHSGFVFSAKASRYITHMKKLKDPKEPVSNFMHKMQNLGDNLPIILFQLPPRWKYNGDRLTSFLETLPANYLYSFEFRDPNWFNDKTYEILSKYKASLCIYDMKGETSPLQITADFVYVRFHGPDEMYTGEYGHDRLKIWKDRIMEWIDDGKEVFVYFNNDRGGYAPRDALRLIEMIG
jgi:uncharacterized protein YecE (DUF72 family)